MTVYLRQSTAGQKVPLGSFVDSTDGVTPETGLTIANTDIKLWKSDASSLVNKSGTDASHMAGGVYVATLGVGDTDTLGPLVLFVYVSGALAVRLECFVMTSAAYDLMTGTTVVNNLSAAQVNTECDTAITDAALATAANLATVAGYLDTEIAAIKAKTDNLPAAPAAVGDIPTAVANADALLGRNISGGSSTGRLVKEALHALRNKQAVAAGVLTVYGPDDSTVSWEAAVTQTAGNPISAIDPT